MDGAFLLHIVAGLLASVKSESTTAPTSIQAKDSLIIWTSFDSVKQQRSLMKVYADEVIAKFETNATKTLNATVIVELNETVSEFWALTADYNDKVLYFTDYKARYFGKWDMEREVTERYLEGMTFGIENIAYDVKTKNIYFTDSSLKWLMVADNSFNYYTPIYRASPDTPYGLALHSVRRILIFSVYKSLGSRLIVTDLAGKNERILFKYPDVFDVTGITIDYASDKIYWVDFLGYGGAVVSSRLDGTGKTQHFYESGAIFWNVASYREFLFVTDVHARYSVVGTRSFALWLVNKQSNQTSRFPVKEKPRGIAVFGEDSEVLDFGNNTIDGCNNQSECHHLCLPRLNATRECACSLGYHLDPKTNQCKAKLIKGKFMLVTDTVQGKVFQLPLENKEVNDSLQYSVVPLGHTRKIHTIAYDPTSQLIYWSEKKNSTLNKANIDGNRYSKIANFSANSIVIDPHTGNLFYLDNENRTIVLLSSDGTKKRTIVKPEEGEVNTTSIKMIAQDIKYKYIYWTETFSEIEGGLGRVMRCRYDGTGKEEVLKSLYWPHAITVDYRTHRLYIVEAKRAMIYEIELPDLVTISNTSPTQDRYKQYSIKSYIRRINPYISDIKIHEEIVYIADEGNLSVQRFNLTEGPSSTEKYGPAEFYSLGTFLLIDNESYNAYIKPQKNPCERMSCPSLCVQISDVTAKCICEDGKQELSNVCTEYSAILSDLATFILEQILQVFRS